MFWVPASEDRWGDMIHVDERTPTVRGSSSSEASLPSRGRRRQSNFDEHPEGVLRLPFPSPERTLIAQAPARDERSTTPVSSR